MISGPAATGLSKEAQPLSFIGAVQLQEAKSDKTHILSATIWLTSMATFAEMNKVWDQWVAPGSTPAAVRRPSNTEPGAGRSVIGTCSPTSPASKAASIS